LNTPIYPPQGATLTNLRVFVYDSSAQASVAEICVLGIYGSVVTAWYGVSSGSSGFTFFDIPIDNHVVDYSDFSYSIDWAPNQLGDTMMVCGFQLFYTPVTRATYMPAVPRNGPRAIAAHLER